MSQVWFVLCIVPALVGAQGGGTSREAAPSPDPIPPEEPIVEQSLQLMSVSDVKTRRTERPSNVRLLAFGDWGDYRAVSRIDTINPFIRSQLPSLNGVLLLGDNFYPAGLNPDLGLDDPKLELFTHHLAAKIQPEFPFYTVLGNNDVFKKNGHLQVEFSRINPNWIMESEDSFFITTTGDVCVWAINSNRASKVASAALDARIISDLAGSTCRWKIFFAHYPMVTAGAYRTSPEVKMFRQNFLPLVQKHNIDFFISGHDHTSQVLEITNSSCTFLVSGATVEVRSDSIDRTSPNVPGGATLVWGQDSLHSTILSLEFSRDIADYKFLHLIEENEIVEELFRDLKLWEEEEEDTNSQIRLPSAVSTDLNV